METASKVRLSPFAFRLLAWAALISAPLVIAWMIAAYGVNVAVFDQIWIGEFLVRNDDRIVPSIGDLFAQHNESRKFFPRLLIFYLARVTGWDVRYEMVVIFLVAAGLAWTVGLLARRTVDHPLAGLAASVAATMLIFSPVQWWNWLFGIQMVVFIPVLMLALALYFADRGPLIPAICCVVATYSYANGMLLWLLVLPAVLFYRRSARTLAIWIASAAVVIGGYFVGYHRPPTHPSLISPFAQPLELFAFVLAFLGHPLTWSDAIAPNLVVGATVVTLFVMLAVAALRRKQLGAAMPWILFGSYSIGSAAMTAVGRLGYGLATAVEPRYTTFAIPMIVSLVVLGFIATPVPLRRAAVAGLMLLVLMHVMASRREWWYARANYRDRLISRAATQWSAALPDDSALRRFVLPDGARAASVIAQVAAIGYVRPPPLTSGLVSAVNGGGDPAKNGKFEGAFRLPGGGRVFYGWAVLPGGRAADAVLITRADHGAEHVVAVSHRTVARPQLLPETGVLEAGWDVPVTTELAVPGSVYTAWGYDTSLQRAYRLAGGVSVGRRARTAARY